MIKRISLAITYIPVVIDNAHQWKSMSKLSKKLEFLNGNGYKSHVSDFVNSIKFIVVFLLQLNER